MDQLALDDVDLLYLSIDPGAHRRDVSVNVRVIRTCIEYRITNDATTIILWLSRNLGRSAIVAALDLDPSP